MSLDMQLVAGAALWLVVLGEAVLLGNIARQLVALDGTVETVGAGAGAPLGTTVPAAPQAGGAVGGARGRPQAVLFLDPRQAACRLMRLWLPEFLRQPGVAAAVVLRGSDAAVREFGGRDLHGLISDPDGRIAARFGSPPSPYVVLLDEAGRIAGQAPVHRLADVLEARRRVAMREATVGLRVREGM